MENNQFHQKKHSILKISPASLPFVADINGSRISLNFASGYSWSRNSWIWITVPAESVSDTRTRLAPSLIWRRLERSHFPSPLPEIKITVCKSNRPGISLRHKVIQLAIPSRWLDIRTGLLRKFRSLCNGMPQLLIRIFCPLGTNFVIYIRLSTSIRVLYRCAITHLPGFNIILEPWGKPKASETKVCCSPIQVGTQNRQNARSR